MIEAINYYPGANIYPNLQIESSPALEKYVYQSTLIADAKKGSEAYFLDIRNANKEENLSDTRVNAKEKDVKQPEKGKEESKAGSQNSIKTDGQLTEAEKQEVQKLKEIDRKVRAHEMAHLAAAAGIAVSGANFIYKRGPDGINYAVGGDVTIDASKERDPQSTIDKARRIVSAAMAPADPSPQDRSVASAARSMEAQARIELMRQQQGESPGNTSNSSINTNTTGVYNNQNTQRPHPGIETYRQIQSSAARTAVYTGVAVPTIASSFRPSNLVNMVA